MDIVTSSRRRIAFLDIDGTITHEGARIADSTIAAIRRAREVGHLVYLSTGRSAGDIAPSVREIGFDGAVTSAGAYATVRSETVLARPMGEHRARRLVEYFSAHRILYFLQSNAEVFANAEMRRFIAGFREARRARDRDGGSEDETTAPPRDLLDAADADLATIARAVFVSTADDTIQRLRADLGDAFDVVPGSMPQQGGSNGEIGAAGVTKGSAIAVVLDHLGMDASDAIGIGDSWNDVEMFQVCGVSVAMGNADPEIRALADRVTTDVLDDGVWNAFDRLGLLTPRD